MQAIMGLSRRGGEYISTESESIRLSPEPASYDIFSLNSIYNWFKNAIEYEAKEGGKGSIVRYNVSYAVTIGWLLPRRGSVFSPLGTLLVVGIPIAASYLLGYYSCVYRPHLSHCVALPPPNTSHLTLLRLCSLLIALFARTVLDRWWTLRSALTGLEVGSENLIMLLSAALSGNLFDSSWTDKAALRAEVDELMKKMIGLVMLVNRALFNKYRGHSGFSDLVTDGYMSQEDHDYYAKNKFNLILCCNNMSFYLNQAASKNLFGKDKKISNSNLRNLMLSVLSIRSRFSFIGMSIDTQLPYPFIQILTSTVTMFFIQLIILCAAFVARGLTTEDDSDIFTGLLTISLYSFVLFGLLILYEVMANPLGDDAADIPGDTYMAELGERLTQLKDNTMNLFDTDEKSVASMVRQVSIRYKRFN